MSGGQTGQTGCQYPMYLLSLMVQVRSDGHLLVRATACDCLREIELAFPVCDSLSILGVS